MSWARAGVIIAAVGTMVPTVSYLEGKWENSLKTAEQAGFNRALADVEEKLKASFTNKVELEKAKAFELGKLSVKVPPEIPYLKSENKRLLKQLNHIQEELSNEKLRADERVLDAIKVQNQDIRKERIKHEKTKIEFNQRLSISNVQITELENKLRLSKLSKEQERGEIQSQLAIAQSNITRLNQIIERLELQAKSKPKVPIREKRCVSAGKIVPVPTGKFIDSCESDATIVVTRAYNAGPNPHIRVAIDGAKEEYLYVGHKIKLKNSCAVSLLGFSSGRINNAVPDLRIKC